MAQRKRYNSGLQKSLVEEKHFPQNVLKASVERRNRGQIIIHVLLHEIS